MIIGFVLDYILSYFFNIYPLFTILSIIFMKSKNKYFITLIIGFLYDITFTNTLFLNAIIFYLILIFNNNYFKNHKFNLLNILKISISYIIFYRITIFLILSIYQVIDFNIYRLLFIIMFSLINIIYVIFRYLYIKYE